MDHFDFDLYEEYAARAAHPTHIRMYVHVMYVWVGTLAASHVCSLVLPNALSSRLRRLIVRAGSA